MPRAKAHVKKDQPKVVDEPVKVESTPTEGELFSPGVALPVVVVVEDAKVEKPKQVRARKPKPCERCDERRRREREYARASRQRTKLTKPAKADESSTEAPVKSADGGADAASAALAAEPTAVMESA